MAESGLNPLGESPELNEYKAAFDRIKTALDAREGQGQMFDPSMLALAQGFLSPTKTGSFGESLGQAAGNYSQQQKEAQKEELSNAQIRMEMAKAGYGMKKELQSAEAARGAFKPRVIPASAGQPERTVYELDPNAVSNIMKSSPNPLKDMKEFSDIYGNLRKSGLLSGGVNEGTPFDAMIAFAPSPMIKQQAERLAKQYNAGLIDDEKANALSQQMLTMATSHMDKESAAKFHQMMTTMTANMSGSIKQQAADLAREKFEAEQKERESKLTDQQKIEYKSVVVPIINEGMKAATAIGQLNTIENVAKKAPSGLLEGAGAASYGRLFGTDSNEAMRNLDALQKSLLTQIPRLPGSQSNFDAQNLEKSIGNLTDMTLTTKQRINLISEIRSGFEKLANRADQVSTHWESNKQIPRSLFEPPKASGITAPTPTTPTAKKFKVIGVEKAPQ